jgi:hypothetical protein
METTLPESITTDFDVGNISHHYDSKGEFVEITLEPRNTYLVDKERRFVLFGKNCQSMENFKDFKGSINHLGFRWFSKNVAKIVFSEIPKSNYETDFSGKLYAYPINSILIKYELKESLFKKLIKNINSNHAPHLITLSLESQKWSDEIYDIDLSTVDSEQGIRVHGIKFERNFPILNASHEELKYVASTVAKGFLMLLLVIALIQMIAVLILIFKF